MNQDHSRCSLKFGASVLENSNDNRPNWNAIKLMATVAEPTRIKMPAGCERKLNDGCKSFNPFILCGFEHIGICDWHTSCDVLLSLGTVPPVRALQSALTLDLAMEIRTIPVARLSIPQPATAGRRWPLEGSRAAITKFSKKRKD